MELSPLAIKVFCVTGGKMPVAILRMPKFFPVVLFCTEALCKALPVQTLSFLHAPETKMMNIKMKKENVGNEVFKGMSFFIIGSLLKAIVVQGNKDFKNAVHPG
jgi:hypothetical protein